MNAKERAAYEDASDEAYGEWNDMSEDEQDEIQNDAGEQEWLEARIKTILGN